MRTPLPMISLLALAALALAACGASGDDDDAATPTDAPTATPTLPPDAPTTDTPVEEPPQAAESLLVAARFDLASRLDVEPLEVTLASLEAAGWDGCLGVSRPGQPCTEQFIAGWIARLAAGGELYRYHLGNGEVIATDFLEGDYTLDDGIEPDPLLGAPVERELVAWVRADLALRLGIEPGEVTVVAIAPVVFDDRCLGFEFADDRGCDDAITPGAIVLLESGGETYRYHASDAGFVATDFEEGEAQDFDIDAYAAVQEAMRSDLAGRLDAEPADFSLLSYQLVTFADSCLGVGRPDATCAQVLTPGFVAELVGPGGLLYRYHGEVDRFVATDFQPEGTVIDRTPQPRGVGDED